MSTPTALVFGFLLLACLPAGVGGVGERTVLKFDFMTVKQAERRPHTFQRVDVLQRQFEDGGSYTRVNKRDEFTGKSVYIKKIEPLLMEAVFKGEAVMAFASPAADNPAAVCSGRDKTEEGGAACLVVELRVHGPDKNCAYTSSMNNQGKRELELQLRLDALDLKQRPIVGQTIAIYAVTNGEEPLYLLHAPHVAHEFVVTLEAGEYLPDKAYALLYTKREHLPKGDGQIQEYVLSAEDAHKNIIQPLASECFVETATLPSSSCLGGRVGSEAGRKRTVLTVFLEKLPPEIRPIPLQQVDIVEILPHDKPQIECTGRNDADDECHEVVLRPEGVGKNCGYIASWVGKNGERKLCVDLDAPTVKERPLVGQTISVYANLVARTSLSHLDTAPYLIKNAASEFKVILEREFVQDKKEGSNYALLYTKREKLLDYGLRDVQLKHPSEDDNNRIVPLKTGWFKEEAWN